DEEQAISAGFFLLRTPPPQAHNARCGDPPDAAEFAPDGRCPADAAVPLACAVRVRDLVPHPVPGLHHRPGALAGVPRMALAAHARIAVARPVFLLAEDLRDLVRHGGDRKSTRLNSSHV